MKFTEQQLKALRMASKTEYIVAEGDVARVVSAGLEKLGFLEREYRPLYGRTKWPVFLLTAEGKSALEKYENSNR